MHRPTTSADFAREPFRIFFPAAILAGIAGVSLWPLYFLHVTETYPGVSHARIMACGFFGGFIFGFLGTAMPRMLSATPLRLIEVILLVLLHAAMVVSFALGRIPLGDELFLALLVVFVCCMAIRARQRKDLPPPGFVLVLLALINVASGTILSLAIQDREVAVFWPTLQRLLSYQGFVLLPILGIGPFLLPRFFGMQTAHDFPESLSPTPAWIKKALLALFAGALIIFSFFIEAAGWYRTAYGLRFATTLGYFLIEMPLRQAPGAANALGVAIRIALAGILAGFLAVTFFPAYRVSLLHLTLIGGFAVLTFTVATRVVFGHSGNIALLKSRNRWLLVALAIMLFAMATRISGDFWPKIMASHYIYGAILWVIGVAVWCFYVLPRLRHADSE